MKRNQKDQYGQNPTTHTIIHIIADGVETIKAGNRLFLLDKQAKRMKHHTTDKKMSIRVDILSNTNQ
jgi:hypothetical protein